MSYESTLERIACALEELVALYRGTPSERDLMEPAYKETASVSVMTSDYEAAVEKLKALTDDIPPEPAPAPEVTKADVIAALNKFAAVHGVAAGKKLLAQFAPRLDEVPVERYAELVILLEVTK